jgi:hypothetical protein
MRVVLPLLLVACNSPTTKRTASTKIPWADDASHCAIGDFDGDGKNEIALGNANEIRIVTPAGKPIATMPITNGLLRFTVADIDHDHHAELYAGWGETREHRDGVARVTMIRLDAGKLTEAPILEPATTRQEVTALVPTDDGLIVAYFDSKYMVTSVLVKPGAAPQPIAQLRTGMAYAYGDVTGDGKPDVVAGRAYGDDIGLDGDAWLIDPRTKIPTTRGVRALAVIDGDVILADGWHQSYATKAQSLLTLAHYANGAFTTTKIDEVPGQYAIEQIVPLRDRGFVTRGTHQVRVYRQIAGTWHPDQIAGAARDVAVGSLHGNSNDDILVLGTPSEIVSIQ